MKTSTLWQMMVLALEYLRGRKLRTTLTILSIVFGVALIFAFNLILPSAKESFGRMISTTSGAADITMKSVTGESFAAADALNTVKGVQGVKAATGVLTREITLPGKGIAGGVGSATQLEVMGIDPTTVNDVREITISEGRALKAEDHNAVLLPAAIASLAPELKVGTTFPLITAGGLNIFNVVGLVADGVQMTTPQITMTLADTQHMFNQPDLINSIDIKLADGANRDMVLADVQKALGEGFQQVSNSSVLDAVTTLESATIMFDILGFFALFMGGFLIFNTFRTVVVERRHDLGMLRAIGAESGQLSQLLIVEGLLQGVIGTVIGLIIGYLLALSAGSGFSKLAGGFISGLTLTISLNAQAFILPIVLGLLTTLLAAYFPARAASRTSPLEALRPATISNMQRAARRGLIIGLVMLVLGVILLLAGSQTGAAGAFLILVGMIAIAPSMVTPVALIFSPILALVFTREGDLAQGNLTRQPGRAAITASTMMIGFAVFIAIAAIVGSFNDFIVNMVSKNFGSDIMIIPPTIAVYGGVIGADDSLATRLQSLPEVETVAGLRYASSIANGQTVQVLGIDPVSYEKVFPLDFSEGNPSDAYSALNSERATVLNSVLASTLKAKVGDTIKLQTADGQQDYIIVGLANDLLSFKIATAFISQANMQMDFHKAEDVMMMLNLKPSVDKPAGLAAVQTVLKDYPQFTARLTGEYRDFMIDTTVGALKLVNVLALVILFPAVLGLLNTLTINVLERTREIGIIRAVGGNRSQVRRIVVAEAILLGIFGAITGIVAGIALSYGFTMAIRVIGWQIPYVFPGAALVVSFVGGIILALLASAIPARNAAKMEIIRALQYE